MKKEKIRYNIDNIDSRGAGINVIVGERSNGKSYQVKHKKGIYRYLFDTDNYYESYKDKGNIIKQCYTAGKRFVLLRRWREEISAELIEKYFDDIDIMSLTDNKYNQIIMYRRELYLSTYDVEENKSKRGPKIGYAVALSTEQKYAGGSFLDVTDIIFEEFMARGMYLPNEPDKLMNFYSTIDRKRGTTKLWLVGNSISRVCPYLVDWGILDILTHMKQGEIKELWIPTGEEDDDGDAVEVKVAIEYCKSTGNSSFVIGKHKDMLNKGEWQSDPQPKLPKSRKEYKKLFRMMFLYKAFKFVCEYIMDKETHETCWFIYPYDGEINNKTIVFSDIIKVSKYWQRDIYNPTFKNQKLCELLSTFKENKIFYATDLCGTDFKQVIDFTIKK